MPVFRWGNAWGTLQEFEREMDRLLQQIRDQGCLAALALNPGTDIAVIQMTAPLKAKPLLMMFSLDCAW